MLVPGPESPGPAARLVHPADDGVLPADVAQQIDRAIHQHPPEVRLLPLVEQLGSGLDAHLGAALSQLGQLIVGQAIEQADGAQVSGAHKAVAGWFMTSASGRRAVCPDRPNSITGYAMTWADSARVDQRAVAGREGRDDRRRGEHLGLGGQRAHGAIPAG